MMLMSMEICMGVEKGGVRLWGIERGGRDLSHIRYLHNYLFKETSHWEQEVSSKKKKSQDGMFCRINFGFNFSKKS